jgi:hypothetical protein
MTPTLKFTNFNTYPYFISDLHQSIKHEKRLFAGSKNQSEAANNPQHVADCFSGLP